MSRVAEGAAADGGDNTLLRISSLHKSFDGAPAVDDISLTIERGEFFALLGPSGCGKTTILRMIAGFEEPDHGTIELEGQSLAGVPPHRRPVNTMFQSYALFPHRTVEGNVAFGLEQEGAKRDEIRQRVHDALAMVQMESFAKRRIEQLSGGQRQRAALARSLVKQPKLLLLDEPLAALDKNLRQQTQFELVNIQEQLGLAFIIVTHDQEEAMTVASRIAVMRQGHIEQVAPPAEIYENPLSRYVAEFIGEINILPGHWLAEGSVHSEQLGVDLKAREVAGVVADAPVWLALRPEKIHISKEPPTDKDWNHVKARVEEIGYLGNLSIYHLRAGPEGENAVPLTVATMNSRRETKQPVTWEDEVYASWHIDSSLVLTH